MAVPRSTSSGQAGVTIRVVFNKLPQVATGIHAGAVAEVAKAAHDIEAAAKAKVPVKTGLLQRSIHSVISAGGLTATVGPSANYGIFIEFGTRHQGARPYMRPAAEAVYPRFTEAMKALTRRGGL
jgi:HK97 gp10 family phage protein